MLDCFTSMYQLFRKTKTKTHHWKSGIALARWSLGSMKTALPTGPVTWCWRWRHMNQPGNEESIWIIINMNPSSFDILSIPPNQHRPGEWPILRWKVSFQFPSWQGLCLLGGMVHIWDVLFSLPNLSPRKWSLSPEIVMFGYFWFNTSG